MTSAPILLILIYGFICLISSVIFDAKIFIILIIIESIYDIIDWLMNR